MTNQYARAILLIKRRKMLFILVGIQSSGKTTLAEEMQQKYKSVILSRDTIRAELRPYMEGKFVGDLHFEERVSGIFNKRLCKALACGKNVIIDNTNIKTKYIKEFLSFAKYFNQPAKIIFAPLTNDLNKCIELNNKREDVERVQEDVIRNYYKSFKSSQKLLLELQKKLDEDGIPEDLPLPKSIPYYCNFDITPYYPQDNLTTAYIFDIDGTLAAHNRNPYDYGKCLSDSIIAPVWNLNQILAEHATIILMSGRPEVDKDGNNVRQLTEEWLGENGVKYNRLLMRGEGDERNDAIVKYELFNDHIRGKYNIMGVFDDRLRVISMWEELGVPVFNVNNGMGDY